MAQAFSAEALPFRPPAIAPDENAVGLIGFLRAMVANPLAALPEAAYREPFVDQKVGGARVLFVCDPAALEEILVRRPGDFPKSLVDERIFRPAFGNSLLVAEGIDWRWKRRLAAPHFTPAALARYLPAMVAPFAALAETLAKGGEATVDVSAAMTRATLEVINTALFSSEAAIDIAGLSQAIGQYLTPISWTIALASLKLPAWLPHPGKGTIRRGQKRMRDLVGELVARRRADPAGHSDICADLMGGRDPKSGLPLGDADLVDMLLTLVAAGHETSANALTWALYCLASQPAMQDELRAEIGRATGGKPVTADDLERLGVVEAFLDETMRLFPPGPLLGRRTTKAETFGGFALAPNTGLFIPVYAIHRHRLLWADPDTFDPARFLGDERKKIARTAYMPFGAGPRVCIGGSFAMMEMVAGLATLLQRLRFELAAETKCEPIQRITLRPKDRMLLAVRPG